MSDKMSMGATSRATQAVGTPPEAPNSIRVKVFGREFARIVKEKADAEAVLRKEREQKERYDRLVAEGVQKHLKDCVREMLRGENLEVALSGFTCTNAYAKDGRFVIQLSKQDGGIKFETLDRLSRVFDTKRIDVDAQATEGGRGCDSCDYGSEPDTYQDLTLSGAFINLDAIKGPQFGPFRPGYFLVVADRDAYYQWISTNVVDPEHAMFVDERALSSVYFWDKEVWKIVIPAARASAPWTHDLVDKLKAMGFKELEE